jgi:hypothetical protein
MSTPDNLNDRLRAAIRDLEQELNKIAIQRPTLRPEEQKRLDQIENALPHLRLAFNELAGDDDTPDWPSTEASG